MSHFEICYVICFKQHPRRGGYGVVRAGYDGDSEVLTGIYIIF